MTLKEGIASKLIERMKGGCCLCPHDAISAATEAIDFMLEQCVPTTFDEEVWKDIKTIIENTSPNDV